MIVFSIESDLNNCKRLWNKHCPKKLFTNIWEFRLAFHKANKNKPYFIVGKVDNKEIGFLPLAYDEYYKQYIFFGGGDWVERNKFFIKKDYKRKYLPQFLNQIPKNRELLYINTNEKKYYPKLEDDQETYFLEPSDYNYNLEKYFNRFSKNSKKTVLYDINRIEKYKPNIVNNQFKDIDGLIKLNIKQFRDDSSFDDPWFKDAIMNIIKDSTLRQHLLFKSIYIDNKIVAAGLYSYYKDNITFLLSGVDVNIKNIFKYLNYQIIKEGFENKVKRIDFLTDECGWKNRWKLKKEMLYRY